jgi:glycerol-3-phosphate cytidylyltransferase
MRGVVGYLPGVFDLYHVGHLDALRRARAVCGRLVVGVLTDEAAAKVWGAPPVVPLVERLEIVGAVREVHRAVPLADLDLRSVCAALDVATVFTGLPDAPDRAEIERLLAGTDVRARHLADLAETTSPVLRSALPGGTVRVPVA